MSNQFLLKLSQNYIELLEDDEYYDITIEVGEDPNVKIFRAHMKTGNTKYSYEHERFLHYDITIEVGEDPNVKIFRAHMNILCYRSSYLRRTFASNKKNKDNVLTHIK